MSAPTRRDALRAGAVGSLYAALPGAWGCAAIGGGGTSAPRAREDTPLAHLYGQEWVREVYRHYAKGYADLETASRTTSKEAYGVVARKGITSLDALQRREVPFLFRASGDGDSYTIARDVPERLTLTADMSADEREAAQAAWQTAREHLHKDYSEIRRLDGAASRLFAEHHRLRHGIDAGLAEQFKITRQLGMLRDNARDLPFELPYKVSREDYGDVLLLLMQRLEEDKQRIAAVESAIVSIGLQVRSTDAGSGSLSKNIGAVMVAVARDADAAISPAVDYPADDAVRGRIRAEAMELRALVEQTDEYRQWLKVQEAAEVVVGGLIAFLEKVTGLPISAAYKEIQAIWRGEADYLGYLKKLVKLAPVGGELVKAIEVGVELTDRLRGAYHTYEEVRRAARDVRGETGITTVRAKGVSLILNAGSRYAKERVGKQLAFFETARDLKRAAEELSAISWLRG